MVAHLPGLSRLSRYSAMPICKAGSLSLPSFLIKSRHLNSKLSTIRGDQRYALGAVLAHNSEPPVPGAGSCIFLHVWESEGAPTAGCTAMALADMSEIATWLDGRASPVLVQLQMVEYQRLREAWGLPAFVAQG